MQCDQAVVELRRIRQVAHGSKTLAAVNLVQSAETQINRDANAPSGFTELFPLALVHAFWKQKCRLIEHRLIAHGSCFIRQVHCRTNSARAQ